MLVGLASAKGAPGVTTLARVLSAIWPTEVILADCDPAGGDLALLGRTPEGEALDHERGLLSLAADARRGVGSLDLGAHLQRLDGGLAVLCGVTSPEQTTGVAPMWPTLASVLHHVPGTNVIADLGRIVPGTSVTPLAQACDALVLVVRPSVEGFGHLRERLRWIASWENLPGGAPAVGVVVISDPKDRRSAPDLGRLLAHSRLNVPVLGQVADDPRAADVVQGRLERGIERSLLVRSTRSLVSPLRALADTRGFAHVRV